MTGSAVNLVESLYRNNRYREAYEQGCEYFGSLGAWDDLVLAGKVATQVGSPRTGAFLHLRAGKREPRKPAAQVRAARAIQRRFGPWEAYLHLKKSEHLLSSELSREDRLCWLSAQLDTLVSFRDFQEARRTLEQMKRVSPEDEWTLISEVALLEAEDNHKDALLMADEFLTRHPSSRSLVQQKADLLENLGRPEEAIEFLARSCRSLESCWLVAQLAQLLNSLERFEDALREYRHFQEIRLLPDKYVDQWLKAGLFRCHYRLGDPDEALKHVGDNPGAALLSLLENLKNARPEHRRRCLDLDFVRQHHSTCGPATVTSIARYWKKEVDHLELADEICYDGTSHSALRGWAERNGWSAREFTLDWETTRRLIDRGLPIALTTVEVDSAHLQAVAGYDEALGLLLLRDPSGITIREALAEKFFERYAFCGLRAMVLIPAEESHRVDCTLPDTELFDLLHELELHLESENRARAEQTAERIRDSAPAHRVTHYAELALACYDENLYGQLEAIEALRRIDPESESLSHREWMIHTQLGHQKRARELLEEVCGKPNCPAVFQSHLAATLMNSREGQPRAARLLRKSNNSRSDSSTGYYYLGLLRWKQRLYEESLKLKRIASCLQDSNEGLALEYFEDCHKLDQAETGLSYLDSRRERYLNKRPDSGQTYITALEQLRRTEEAHHLLEELLQRHPEDSGLNLFATDFHARYGHFEKALEHLERAKLNASELNLFRTAAKLEMYRGRIAESAELWEKIVRREPTATEAVMALCSSYQAMGEHSRAVESVKALMDRYPQNVPLKRLYYSVEQDNEQCRRVLESLLEITPNDAWAWSRYAFSCELLENREKSDEALSRALKLSPDDSSVRLCQAQVRYRRGELGPAKEACREAVRCNLIEAAPALLVLLQDLCAEPEERREELEFLWKEITGQPSDLSASCLLYQSFAGGVMDPGETYARLRELMEKRPHSLEILIALINQALSMSRLEEALELAEKATTRFPHDTLAWNKLADIHRQAGRVDRERECLEKALAIEPTASSSIRRLADNLRHANRVDEALELLSLGAAGNPRDHLMLGYLAEVQWLTGQRELAVETLQRAVKIDSSYLWGWNKLAAWSTEHTDLKSPLELARELLEERPKDSTNWLRLFELLPQDAHEERLAALDNALSFSPLDADLHDAKAIYLAELNRYPEALAACTPEVWGERTPITLQGRRCWVWASRGELDRAVSEMKKVLAKEPDYCFGILMMARWLSADGHSEESLDYLKRATELQPENTEALLWLAQALDESGKDSRETLRQALRADPTESNLLHHLLEADLAKNDQQAVKSDMQEWNHLLLPEEETLYLLVLDGRNSDRESFERRLAELARSCTEEWTIARAVKQAIESEYAKAARQVLEQVGKEGSGTRYAGVHYYALLEHLGVPNTKKLLAELPPETPFRYGVLGSCLDDLDHSDFKRLLGHNRTELLHDTYCWANVMRRMFRTPKPDYQGVVDWSDDWEKREGLEPWMLFNRATALREVGRKEEAHQLLVWVDQNLPGDSAYCHLKTVLALGYLEEGRPERALLNLSAAHRDSLSDYYKVVHLLLGARLRAMEGRLKLCKELVGETWRKLPAAQWDGLHKRLHREALQSFLSTKPGIADRLWVIGQVIKREQLWYAIVPILLVTLIYLREHGDFLITP